MDNICTTKLYKEQNNPSLHDSNRAIIDRRRGTRNSIHRKNMHRRRTYPLYCSCR